MITNMDKRIAGVVALLGLAFASVSRPAFAQDGNSWFDDGTANDRYLACRRVLHRQKMQMDQCSAAFLPKRRGRTGEIRRKIASASQSGNRFRAAVKDEIAEHAGAFDRRRMPFQIANVKRPGAFTSPALPH